MQSGQRDERGSGGELVLLAPGRAGSTTQIGHPIGQLHGERLAWREVVHGQAGPLGRLGHRLPGQLALGSMQQRVRAQTTDSGGTSRTSPTMPTAARPYPAPATSRRTSATAFATCSVAARAHCSTSEAAE